MSIACSRSRLGLTRWQHSIVTVAAVVLLGAGAVGASASTFCVRVPACPAGGIRSATLPDAVAAAQQAHDAGQARNRVLIGPGRIPYAGEADDFRGNPIDFVGAGQGKTILEDLAAGGGGGRVLGLVEPASTVSQLTIRLVSPRGAPAAFTAGGLLLRDGASAAHVDIDGRDSGPNSIGLDLRGSSTFADGSVTMPAPSGRQAVDLEDAGGNSAIEPSAGSTPGAVSSIRRARLTGVNGIDVTFDGTARASQVRVLATGSGVLVDGGQLWLYDSLIRTRSVSDLPAREPPSRPANAIVAVATGRQAIVTADNVTAVGDGTGFGLLAGGSRGGGPARLYARNVALSGFDTGLLADASHPGTRLDIDLSAFSSANVTRPNRAMFRGPHNVDLRALGFVSLRNGDLTPSPCSPLVNHGDPAPLAANEPRVDLAGHPRVLPAIPSGAPRRDIGAFEYDPGRHGGCPTNPRLSISRRAVRLARGRAVITVSCPKRSRVRCSGTLSLIAAQPSSAPSAGGEGSPAPRPVVLGQAGYQVPPGQGARIRVGLSRAGETLILRARGKRVVVSASAAQAGFLLGPTSSTAVRLLLIG